MAATPSTMKLQPGDLAPDFDLPTADGGQLDRAGASGPAGVLVAFLCNHCPFVLHVQHELATLGRELPGQGLGMVGINANDGVAYPADAYAAMAPFAASAGWSFPYLHDASQDVARAYGAACTPDFFLFDREGRLVYRGQLDGSRPGNGVPVTGEDLRAAIAALLAGAPPLVQQRPSLGCSIKWRQAD